MKEPIAREVEGIDLNLHLLTGMDEPDVAVGDHGLDLKRSLGRNHYRERLSGSYHASNRMNGELLHDAIDGCGQALELGPLFRIDSAPILRDGFFVCLFQQRDGGVDLAKLALLDDDVLLKTDQILQFSQIDAFDANPLSRRPLWMSTRSRSTGMVA